MISWHYLQSTLLLQFSYSSLSNSLSLLQLATKRMLPKSPKVITQHQLVIAHHRFLETSYTCQTLSFSSLVATAPPLRSSHQQSISSFERKVASCKCCISSRSNLTAISKDYYQWHVLYTIDNVLQRIYMMLNALIYKLATLPFGVIVMSVRWEAVKQIICMHILF